MEVSESRGLLTLRHFSSVPAGTTWSHYTARALDWSQAVSGLCVWASHLPCSSCVFQHMSVFALFPPSAWHGCKHTDTHPTPHCAHFLHPPLAVLACVSFSSRVCYFCADHDWTSMTYCLENVGGDRWAGKGAGTGVLLDDLFAMSPFVCCPSAEMTCCFTSAGVKTEATGGVCSSVRFSLSHISHRFHSQALCLEYKTHRQGSPALKCHMMSSQDHTKAPRLKM